MTTRLYLRVTAEGFVPSPTQSENLVSFLTHEAMPNDLRLMLHRDLVRDAGPEVKEVMRNKDLAELALSAL